ncbi:NAD-binding protein [Gilvimarinus agarilyticus]|uniref:CASTOR/POLLUX-related putative ion channel n=1 Tax=Reichenbachiella agariperforans TaxID=156994 RepID=UPI001C0A02AA|nr:NAD-binding protein [Reichenbachiella agariperforans]MBU2884575.1 NAD-binding protein [Gilvimarinus agarilyticus]MBU2915126.1 NAD-binding protein [Reichenbachiella agariperforans]
MSKTAPLTARLKYAFDNYISKGTGTLIGGLALLTLILVFILAVILILTGIHPDQSVSFTIFDSLWENMIHMLDPGTLGDTDSDWGMRSYLLFVTLIGVVVLSTLIGLVSNGILTKIEELRKGRSFVIERNHTLILGWSSKIFTIISELIEANENLKEGVIVILADKDKVEMEDEIKLKVGDTRNTRVICRTGDPIDIDDIHIANPFDSKSIIILDKDNENSDSQIIKTIVAIVTNPRREELRSEPYHITAEITDSKNLEVAKMVGKDEVELILSDDFISRIMVQTSRQSGLSVVYIELMDYDGDEIYFTDEKTEVLVGKTFRDIIFAYEKSAIMGIQFADGTVAINPPMDTVFNDGDKVIGITEDDDTLIPSGRTDYEIDESRVVHPDDPSQADEKILIIGWNDRAKNIISELDQYAPFGSTLKIVSKFEDPIPVIEKLKSNLKNLSVEFVKAETTERETLENLNIPSFDYIMLLCYEQHFPVQEADAQTLITLLHIRSIAERTEKHLNLVSEMIDMKNRQLADITSADDFIVSDKLLSLLMTQVSENKFLMRVFEDLFDADGSEIYIKPAKEYVTPGKPVNFYTVLESAAQLNQVAIGYRILANSRNVEKQYGVVVNPDKAEYINFTEKDEIIVLSED